LSERHAPEGSEPGLLSSLQKHLVPIYFDLCRDSDRHQLILTAFVLEVRGIWFLVTAGHALKEIHAALSHGYDLSHCRLLDFVGPQASFEQEVPFEYNAADAAVIDVEGMDYGVIPLHPIHTRQLQANHVKSLDEGAWHSVPEKLDTYRLLGIPAERVRFSEGRVTIGTVLTQVNAIADDDHYQFEGVTAPMFYGTVTLGELESIVGTSGGPVFGFRRTSAGYDYWLIGVQSAWEKSSRTIAAAPVLILASAIAKAMEEEDALE
jgi:hypothetical protein